MKKSLLPMHKNLPAPRSPFPDALHSNKPDKGLKRTGSSNKIHLEKHSKPKSGNSNPKTSKTGISSTEKQSKSKGRPKSMKKSSHKQFDDSSRQSKRRNVYTGHQQLQGKNFMETITDKSFKNLQTLKLNLLSYIFKNRLVRDQQYNDLYEQMVEKFPQREDIIKNMLTEILSTLDS